MGLYLVGELSLRIELTCMIFALGGIGAAIVQIDIRRYGQVEGGEGRKKS